MRGSLGDELLAAVDVVGRSCMLATKQTGQRANINCLADGSSKERVSTWSLLSQPSLSPALTSNSESTETKSLVAKTPAKSR